MSYRSNEVINVWQLECDLGRLYEVKGHWGQKVKVRIFLRHLFTR